MAKKKWVHSRNDRLYGIWIGMKSRCYRKTHHEFHRYGERGITVCDEWLNSHDCFYDWAISHGYNDSLTIERKNNNAGYSPENCEWISRSDQARNRSTSFLVEHNSEKVSCADLSRMYGLEKHTILNRLRKGIPLEEAISQQSRTGRLYSICGETGTIQQIAERHGLNRSTLLGRIRRGVPDSELFAPPKKTHLATK